MTTNTEQTTKIRQTTTEESAEITTLETKQVRQPFTWDEAITLIQKHLPTKKLSRADEASISLALRDNPGLWRAVGDMALQTQGRMIEAMAAQPVAQLAIRHGVATMHQELGGEDAPLIERLLIDQLILCWLNLNWVQRSYVNNVSDSHTFALGTYWEKRLSTAQSRYLKAMETLAKVRKLSRATPVQVNIGGQQINVAGIQE